MTRNDTQPPQQQQRSPKHDSAPEAASSWLRIGPRWAWDAPFRCVSWMFRDAQNKARGVFVVSDLQGGLHAYRNECMHVAIPLDLFSGDLWNNDGTLLRCLSHGALYRPEDGVCVSGPCLGSALASLHVMERDGDVYLLEEQMDPR